MPDTVTNYFCKKVAPPTQFALCAPVGKAGRVLAALPPAVKPEETSFALKNIFKSSGDIFEISPAEIKANIPPATARFYDISPLLPPVISEKNHTIENFPGPNCFYAALYTAGIIKDKPRYVDPVEFSYFLTREMMPADPSATNILGAIAVFQPAFSFAPPSAGVLYKAGEHAGFTIPGGFLFQKLGWYKSDNYEIVPFEQAMINVDYAAWTHLDRFERGDSPRYQKYAPAFFVKRTTPLPKPPPINIKPQDAFRWLELFDFYSKKLERYNEISGEVFLNNRLNLFTVDNIWELLQKFDGEFLKSQPANLLRLDKPVAEAYLRLKSLSWQYEAMKDEYSPRSEGNINDEIAARKKLYAEHYLRDRALFKEEVYVHLAARNIAPSACAELFKKVEAEVMKRAPAVIQTANEGNRISLSDIIDQVVTSRTPVVPKSICQLTAKAK